MKKTILALIAVCASVMSFSASAQFAKPEVWKQNAKFKEAADKFQAESVKLVAATKTGKEDAFKAAFTATAGTCKSCHDDFKNK